MSLPKSLDEGAVVHIHRSSVGTLTRWRFAAAILSSSFSGDESKLPRLPRGTTEKTVKGTFNFPFSIATRPSLTLSQLENYNYVPGRKFTSLKGTLKVL